MLRRDLRFEESRRAPNFCATSGASFFAESGVCLGSLASFCSGFASPYPGEASSGLGVPCERSLTFEINREAVAKYFSP